mgnify:CR=1 FL=1
MIISRTPFRVSFVGGGTDLKSFYEHEDGMVLSTTIDKYIYVTVHRQVGIVEHKYRIGWSKVEFKDEIDDIEHPIVREALRLMEIDFPVEITTFADVPGFTGLGSSSSFAVGLLHALFALKGEMVTKSKLAIMAAKIEIDLLKRSIGAQDHFAASYGGMNIFTFHKNEKVSVEPVFCRENVLDALSKNLMLFYTNIKRDASEILTVQSAETLKKLDVLKGMKNLVMPLSQILSKGSNINEVGDVLHKGWQLKKSITSEISSTKIDEHYNLALNVGALGGKLLGAGGGGFLMLYVEPHNQKAVCDALSDLYLLDFKFDAGGTCITYYDQAI